MATYGQTLPVAKHKDAYSDGGYVSASVYDYAPIARQITGKTTTNYDKAKAIYLWLCDNIAYDPSGEIRTADACWNERKGVCQGYCELFYRMAESVGVKAKLVYGNCKSQATPQQTEKHVWLSVKTERGELLMDPTWGAGQLINGKFRKLPNPLIWFDTDPAWFAFTHMPQHTKHQHLAQPLSQQDFTLLPYISPLAARLGLTPEDAQRKALGEGLTFVVMPLMNADFLQKIRLLNVPLEHSLKAGSAYTFQIEKVEECCTLSIENELGAYDEQDWSRQGQTYTLTLSPKWKGKLCVKVTTENPLFTSKKAVLEYVVE